MCHISTVCNPKVVTLDLVFAGYLFKFDANLSLENISDMIQHFASFNMTISICVSQQCFMFPSDIIMAKTIC